MLFSILAALAAPTTPAIATPPVPIVQAAIDVAAGKISRVDSEGNAFVLTLEDGKTLNLRVNDKTTYKKGEKPARKEDVLAVGNAVSVTHADGTASLITMKADD